MKAIELNSATDKDGNLKLDFSLGIREKQVRVLLLFDDNISKEEEEVIYMNALSNNPAFDFLKEPDEDIYSINDGEPIND